MTAKQQDKQLMSKMFVFQKTNENIYNSDGGMQTLKCPKTSFKGHTV